MEDNWSLKGKYNLIEGMFLCTEDDWKTLREKLIEKINCNSELFFKQTHRIIKEINELFGVEE